MAVFSVNDFKRVFRVYLVILEETIRGPLSVSHLSDPASKDTSREAAEESMNWLRVLDAAIPPARLRVAIQRLQPSEQDVQAVIRFLACKSTLEDEDQERLEFLLAFAFRNRGGWEHPDALTTMAQEIQSWLQASWREVSPAVAKRLRQLEEVCQGVLRCNSFTELVPSRLIERGRVLKQACGADIEVPAVLAAVTRYNLWTGRHVAALLDRARQAEDFPRETIAKDYRRAGEDFRQWVDSKVDAVLPNPAVRAPDPVLSRPGPASEQRIEPRAEKRAGGLRGDPLAEERKFQTLTSQVIHLARAARELPESISLPNTTLALTPWEFQSLVRDYPETEASFRVEVNRELRQTVGLLAAISEESSLYHVRRSSEYLWKKHLNSLAYLADLAAPQVVRMQDLVQQARARGLHTKAEQLAESTAKLESRLQEISELGEEHKEYAVAARA